jgi:hypothetical protein
MKAALQNYQAGMRRVLDHITLVPWRAVIGCQLGREVFGIVQGGSVSWQLGQQWVLEL